MYDTEAGLGKLPLVTIDAGEYLLHQGSSTAQLFFLSTGRVRVIKDGQEITTVNDKGAVFGDMSVLLGIPHSASVLCVETSTFHVIDNPAAFLQSHPELLWHMARILGMRLFNLNQYLVDLKNQYEGHDHLGMVDEVLESLMNQQKTGSLKRGEGKREVPDY
jgi:CRP/FNR family cyclic AMP-dependent transcriptional regulator